MSPERRERVRQGVETARTGWRVTWRECLWFFGALDDRGDPSAAMFFAVALGFSYIRHFWRAPASHEFGVAETIFVGLIVAALFGRSMFAKWLATKQVQGRAINATFRREAEPDSRTDDERG